jgi:RNA polymerase sigma-70 factor (ECF subfamily)
MRSRSDEFLMKSYVGGDMDAFEQLYQRYRAPLYRYLLRQVREPAAANDLFQDIWERIVKARRQYRPSAPFRAWLFRIAHNRVVDYFRQMRDSSGIPVDSLAGETQGPDGHLDAERRDSQLVRAIAGLPPEQREVVLLRLESGLGIRDIAEICGTRAETAKSRLRYAVAKLKQSVGTAQEAFGET